ncbi:GNAT family N-acetyltransferase [Streptomyces sp. Li-HN-5-11]|uniref:GNAT family N-acetyltransferase n=1 Tax=Streptomyces sp. Li-HN-5-11 TaxID=3075432 RepID=UPI0028ACF061|nr:GNAT family N-acetyltransferase [Streptomyces sp. Li-HN-5-11]WNM35868.1 GNAT family N-acetyltransferase [Streptomyces sp. Li-HN-5-11]
MITLARSVLLPPEIDELRAVCTSNPAYWRYSGDLDPEDMSDEAVHAMLREDASADGCELLTARDEQQRVIGLAQILLRHPRDGHPWITLLLVDGDTHRRGHGRAIAAALENRFRSEGEEAVRLGVLQNNIEAQHFWTAMGYEQIDLRPDVAKGRPTLVMHKDLRTHPL